MTLKITPEPVRSFVTYKQVIQNCSKLTCEKYEHDLSLFFRFMISKRENRPFDEVDVLELEKIDLNYVASIKTEDVYAFLLYLANERDNGDNARARRLSTLRAFYKYHTQKSKTLTDNPVKDIDSPNIKHKLPKYLSIDESLDLLDSVDKGSKTYARDYCMLTLFLNCGMRLSELVNINLTDIKDDFSSLVVTGKGSKQRLVPLSDEAISQINFWMQDRCHLNIKPGNEDYLFLNRRGAKLTRVMILYIVKDLAERAGIKKNISPHTFRHSFATHLLEGGANLRLIQMMLGHENLVTTEIYTHLDLNYLREEVIAHHPRNNKKGGMS